MDKLKSASAVAEKAKAKNDSDMKASQAQIDSQAARIQQLLEVISDREDALEAANRETKKSIDDSVNKDREASMEIDTLKGELANCHNNCDLLADDLKVCICHYMQHHIFTYISTDKPLQLFIRVRSICLSL